MTGRCNPLGAATGARGATPAGENAENGDVLRMHGAPQRTSFYTDSDAQRVRLVFQNRFDLLCGPWRLRERVGPGSERVGHRRVLSRPQGALVAARRSLGVTTRNVRTISRAAGSIRLRGFFFGPAPSATTRPAPLIARAGRTRPRPLIAAAASRAGSTCRAVCIAAAIQVQPSPAQPNTPTPASLRPMHSAREGAGTSLAGTFGAARAVPLRPGSPVLAEAPPAR